LNSPDFFVNVNQALNDSDSKYARGTVGVMIFRRGTDPASTRLLVDWARMSNP